MRLFKSDLYRNFAIGFIVGTTAVVASAAPEWQAEFAPSVLAAEAAIEQVGNDSSAQLAMKAP